MTDTKKIRWEKKMKKGGKGGRRRQAGEGKRQEEAGDRR